MRVAAALLVVWLVWGSTYLAVAQLLPALPPFLLSALRFLLAAPLLGLIAAISREPWPERAQIRTALIVGVLLFLGGNGGTVFAQTFLPSGLAAVLVGLVPLWLVAGSAIVERRPPEIPHLLGITLGLIGVAGLAGGLGGGQVHPVGVLSIVCSSACWATGSLIARKRAMPASVAWSSAIQMSAGGVALSMAAVATGQAGRADPSLVGPIEIACFLWLVGGGSLLALVAYNWLLRHTAPAVATSYAYVNPLVAVWLGWWLGGEHLEPAQIAWSSAIVAAVALVLYRRPSGGLIARWLAGALK